MEKRFEKFGFKLNRPVVISGPCSVESEEQVMETALGLQNYDVDILRGGIWKPRTRPNSFEGVGEKGLPWLKKASEAIGKPSATEVATAKHVEACLKHEIDYLWIGARTSVNPFAVQEIADALQGVEIPVFVKNPINPDLKLWLGAIERIEKAGITKIAAIHRGFSVYGESIYRNTPIWKIPMDFRLERPEMPMICDPSHIAGKRSLLMEIAQQALDLSFDGLMIESHINPDVALSDAKQQVTPDRFHQITQDLRQRTFVASNDKIESLRPNVKALDLELLAILEKRMENVQLIGKAKKQDNIAIYQPEQLKKALDYYVSEASKYGLSKEFVVNLFREIHKESIKQQRNIFKN